MPKDIFYDGELVTQNNDLRITHDTLTDLNRARNILRTVKGEYPYNLELGVNLQDYLGKPISNNMILQSYIRSELTTQNLNVSSIYLASTKERTIKIQVEIKGNTLEV